MNIAMKERIIRDVEKRWKGTLDNLDATEALVLGEFVELYHAVMTRFPKAFRTFDWKLVFDGIWSEVGVMNNGEYDTMYEITMKVLKEVI